MKRFMRPKKMAVIKLRFIGIWIRLKKTVLKKALKYAPLKSDFLRGLSSDETVKSTIDPDMFDVPNEVSYADADFVEVDQETGEVISTPAAEAQP